MHILPDGFHKLRHIGLYASPEKSARARVLLSARPLPCTGASWQQRLLSLTGRDVTACPCCLAPLTTLALPAIRAPPRTRP
jgi:hypothetical protein